MDRDEDVLVLYTTSHGSPHAGLNFRDPARGAAVIAPAQLAGDARPTPGSRTG